VAGSAVVACDAQTCAHLSGQKVQVGKNSTSLSNATLVVVTPTLRTLFRTNPSLGADVASVHLASYGSGSSLVTVQVVDPSGGGAYMTAFNQAITKRTNVGRQLVNTGKVYGDKSDLAAGAVDPRLMLIIKALAPLEAVDAVGFADSGPGASAGVPFRVMYLGTTDPSGKRAAGAYLQAIKSLLQAHVGFPAPQFGAQTVNGQKVVQIYYPAPSPN